MSHTFTKDRRLVLVTLVMIAVALACFASRGSAQGREPLRQPVAIPVDLATALISSGGFGGEGDPQILVGSLPEWLTARLYLPPGARVLGSAFVGRSVVGVLSVPTSSDTLLKAVERELLLRGWKAPPVSPGGGGFRPAPTATTFVGGRMTLCGDNQALTGWISRRRADSTTLIVRLFSDRGFGICTRAGYAGERDRTEMPTLYNPESATDMRMGSGCDEPGFSSAGTRTSLRTGMKAAALLEHYGRQLEDSGWVSASMLPSIAGHTWTRRDANGVITQALITVTTSPQDSSCHSVQLEARSSRDRP